MPTNGTNVNEFGELFSGGPGRLRDRRDPESPLRWTTKSTAKLAEELAGHGVPPDTLRRLLKEGYIGTEGQVEHHDDATDGRCPSLSPW